MITRGAAWLILLSITACAEGTAFAQGIGGKGSPLRPGPATSYSTKQTNNGLTIAALPYDDVEKLKPYFGKTNLLQFGIFPVMLILQNDTGKALNLETLELHYVTADRLRLEETPASEVQYLDGPRRPRVGQQTPLPIPIPRGKAKSKLAIPEITGFAFNAKMLPAGESAHGFVYFQTTHQRGSKVYVRGITEAATRKELLFFEVSLE
ncbi:MAG: hypothetical protein HYZ37_02305 [Candidatus Solibacter usitatus]|nr:hypothetical protein [Candidatus Solibacter usitatus]